MKKKAPYIEKSTATHYWKYRPSGIYTKAAKSSLSITKYYIKSASQIESEAATGADNTLESVE